MADEKKNIIIKIVVKFAYNNYICALEMLAVEIVTVGTISELKANKM